jgi:hypothetical protein
MLVPHGVKGKNRWRVWIEACPYASTIRVHIPPIHDCVRVLTVSLRPSHASVTAKRSYAVIILSKICIGEENQKEPARLAPL